VLGYTPLAIIPCPIIAAIAIPINCAHGWCERSVGCGRSAQSYCLRDLRTESNHSSSSRTSDPAHIQRKRSGLISDVLASVKNQAISSRTSRDHLKDGVIIDEVHAALYSGADSVRHFFTDQSGVIRVRMEVRPP